MTTPMPVDDATMALIEDAVTVLCQRGHLDPDDDEPIPAELITELASLTGPCGGFDCPDPIDPWALADHWVTGRQQAWERSLATWTCDCGRVYKVIQPAEFYDATEDGLLGDRAGCIARDRKGRVKHSAKCRGCGELFAVTIDRQTNPQQSLF